MRPGHSAAVLLVPMLLAALQTTAKAASSHVDAAPRRPTPNYSGRSPEPTRAGDVLIWVPRVVFYPVHRVLDSFVRWPVWRFTGWAEKVHLFEWVKHIFIWRDGKAGIFPTFYYEFGLRPSVGFYFFHHDLLVPGHDIAFRGGFWGPDYVRLGWNSRQSLFGDGSGQLTLAAGYLTRPDRRFFGVGPATSSDLRTSYAIDRIHASARFEARLRSLSRVALRVSYRRVRFGPGQEEISIERKFDVTDPTQVPGFEGYSLVHTRLSLDLDTRRADVAAPGSGVRLQLRGSFAVDPARPELHFAEWGGRAGAFLDVTGHGHILGLNALATFMEPTGDAPIPFTELATLGGRYRLRGFLQGRFRGLSAIELSLTYRYPIWAYLDAELFLETGNVFDRHLRDFAWKRLFLDGGIALRSHTSRDLSFDLILGFGSNRLDSADVALDSVHFAVGVTAGF